MKKFFLLIPIFLLLVAAEVTSKRPLAHRLSAHDVRLHALMAKHMLLAPPIDSGEYFLASSSCKGCHGYDPAGVASVDLQGNDVNLVDDWQATMMALSAYDPVWRAKVRQEILTNPGHAVELQTFCASCHAPMGRYNAKFKGIHTYTLDDLYQDTLGLGGIGCLACHAIKDEGLGALFSGNIPYDSTHKAYGPFAGPVLGPMQLYEGFNPVYGPHMSESASCSACHTLVTHTADLNGQATGQRFVEQATYHEWLNSKFPGEGTQCQSCHMPKIEDPVKLAVGYLSIPGRSPFNLHKFSGANAFMVGLMKQNKNQLGIQVADIRFDETLADILETLKKKSAKLSVNPAFLLGNTVGFDVEVENLAGHKLPSGYPARRLILELELRDALTGQTLFHSGKVGSDGEVENLGGPWQPHHDVITQPQQAQVYELVMADVNSNRTTVLERAASALKDNRLPPKGFLQSHSVYDTVKVVGVPPQDGDFNVKAGQEGSGTDVVHYQIQIPDGISLISVFARLNYQPLPPSWMDEMFAWDAPEINAWKAMYQAADKTPIVIAADSLLNVPTYWGNTAQDETAFTLYPNPVTDGRIRLPENLQIKEVRLWNSRGRLLRSWSHNALIQQSQLTVPTTPGTYFLQIELGTGTFVRKFIVP